MLVGWPRFERQKARPGCGSPSHPPSRRRTPTSSATARVQAGDDSRGTRPARSIRPSAALRAASSRAAARRCRRGRWEPSCGSQVTLPIAPAQRYSQSTRIPALLCPWLPSCVVTLYCLAAAANGRHSAMEWASGFSHVDAPFPASWPPSPPLRGGDPGCRRKRRRSASGSSPTSSGSRRRSGSPSSFIFGIVLRQLPLGLGDVLVVHVAKGDEAFAQPGDLVDADLALVRATDHGDARLRVRRRIGQQSRRGEACSVAAAPAATVVLRNLRRWKRVLMTESPGWVVRCSIYPTIQYTPSVILFCPLGPKPLQYEAGSVRPHRNASRSDAMIGSRGFQPTVYDTPSLRASRSDAMTWTLRTRPPFNRRYATHAQSGCPEPWVETHGYQSDRRYATHCSSHLGAVTLFGPRGLSRLGPRLSPSTLEFGELSFTAGTSGLPG